MWTLIASAATIAFSLLAKEETSDVAVTKRDIRMLSSLSQYDRTFLSGIVLGAGLSMLYTVVQTHFRFHDRLRLLWNNSWDRDIDYTLLLKEPKNVKQLSGSESAAVNNNTTGTCTILVSPTTAITSTMHIAVMRLPIGTEIQSQIAVGVEFYFVLSGTGLFSQQGVHVTTPLSKDDGFVVHPGTMRWISNARGTEDLVLLRATDGGSAYNSTTLNSIRMDPMRKVSALQHLNDGIRHIQKMAKNYVESTRSDT